MSETDRIWDELEAWYRDHWRLREIPFSESAPIQRPSQLHEVFTGREKEMRTILNLFRGYERKRILIYGWVGIGKTAFILEVLNILKRKATDILTTYISLPPETDLAKAALIALASEMEDDDFARELLDQMRLRSKSLSSEEEIMHVNYSLTLRGYLKVELGLF